MSTLFEKRILLTIIGFVLVCFAIGGGVIYPTYRYIKQIDSDTYNLRVTLERKNEQATNYRFALRQIEKIKKEMPDFTNNIFYSGDELKLITTLETLAADQGVSQRIISSNLDSITNQRILISLGISGTYKKVITYLDKLEHLPYFITPTRVTINPITDRANPDSADNVNMNLDISLYVVP